MLIRIASHSKPCKSRGLPSTLHHDRALLSAELPARRSDVVTFFPAEGGGRIANLVEPPLPWQFAAMSTLSTLPTDPKELRPLLHERIEHATDEELEAVRKALLAIEARRLADEISREFEEDWRSGKITEEKIAQAILEHRARHPYR